MGDRNRDIHIVVVGGASAGLAAARQLSALRQKGYPNLQVTLVDQSSHYFHAIGFPKALVDEAFAKQCFLPYTKFFYTASEADSTEDGAGHRFVNQRLVAVRDAHHVELENGNVLFFDYLVLATGTRTPSPANVGAVTKEGGLREIAELREGLQAAESVLVVGGGAVGVETAGYVAATYPEKQVTLVHSGERLLPTYFREGVGNGAVSKLRSLGVRVVFGERVEVPSSFGYGAHIGRETLKGASGEEYTSDVQILATGFTVHSEYIKPLEDLIEEPLRVAGRGFIKVRPTLQIDSDRFPHIFVPGDVNSLPMSAKYGFKAEMQGHAVAGNITKMVQDGFDEAFKNQDTHEAVHEPKLNAWHDMLDAILVPIGPHLGVAQAFKVALGGSWLANFVVRRMKAGDFFLWQKKAMFAGLSK